MLYNLLSFYHKLDIFHYIICMYLFNFLHKIHLYINNQVVNPLLQYQYKINSYPMLFHILYICNNTQNMFYPFLQELINLVFQNSEIYIYSFRLNLYVNYLNIINILKNYNENNYINIINKLVYLYHNNQFYNHMLA